MLKLRKNKVLGWIIVVGLVINIAAISTILYKVYFQKDRIENNRFHSKKPHEFISKELNLSPDFEKIGTFFMRLIFDCSGPKS